MKILLTAPQPFYRERGTPIAVRLLAETLCEAGNEVDLLTYHVGENISFPGLTLHRIAAPPLINDVPIGFSLKKAICDIFLLFKTAALLAKNRYDVIHAVEESIFTSLAVNVFARKKLVYDMDSLMADQMIEKWEGLRIFSSILYAFEKIAVRNSDLVIAVCSDLAEKAREYGPETSVRVVEDIPLSSTGGETVDNLRESCGVKGLLALYVGNLEPYQGIDLLLEGFALARITGKMDVVIIGGSDEDRAAGIATAEKLGVAKAVHFVGPRPVADLHGYLRQADIVVSPRTRGVNTPMKIFSYLASGKPLLATRIASHTQVLDDSTALLVNPEAASLGDGLTRLGEEAGLRRRLGEAGLALAHSRYSRAAYRDKLLEAYALLAEGGGTAP